jgi:Fe2+ or Zn2+ uptake regulation protein
VSIGVFTRFTPTSWNILEWFITHSDRFYTVPEIYKEHKNMNKITIYRGVNNLRDLGILDSKLESNRVGRKRATMFILNSKKPICESLIIIYKEIKNNTQNK